MSKLRINEDADALISGRSPHPLLAFQRANQAALQLLGVLILSGNQLVEDPFGCYQRFTQYLTEALHRHPGPVPAIGDLRALEESYQLHRRAQRHIYSTILETLQVGNSMHYARRVRFGAGLHLLNVIRDDNRQVTTRSLMALFSALLSLQLKTGESFEQFSRRIDLLIQRLLNWRPPVILPDQLLLFCALRALPDVPYGPVRHIILASPNVNFFSGMNMLRDVANTGAKLIKNTLGSGQKTEPSAVLCADPCPTSPGVPRNPSPGHRSRRTPAGRRSRPRKPRGPSKLCQKEGPCIHHGPHSFHATSECRDPTLSRSKKAQPRPPAAASSTTAAPASLAGIATASQPPLAPDHLTDSVAQRRIGGTSDIMYSPIFLTQISSAARREARTQFIPHPRHAANLRRGPRAQRSTRTRYHPNTISTGTLNSCVRTYTRPIHGEAIPDFRGDQCKYRDVRCKYHRVKRSTPKSRRDRNLRRRRRVRNWRNRIRLYPDGVLKPARQRQPRKFSPGPSAGAKDRRRRRRKQQLPKDAPTRPLPPHQQEPSNLPLPLSISLLVSCSTCGVSVELPWSHSTTHSSEWSASPVYDIPLKPPNRQTFSARKRWNKWHRSVSQRNRSREPAYPKWVPPVATRPVRRTNKSRASPPARAPPRKTRNRPRRTSSSSCGNCPAHPPKPRRSPLPRARPPNPNNSSTVSRSPPRQPHLPAAPTAPDHQNILHLSRKELEIIARRELHRAPPPNESTRDAHIRIGTAFAASAQLEELRPLQPTSLDHLPDFFLPEDTHFYRQVHGLNISSEAFSISTCLLGDVTDPSSQPPSASSTNTVPPAVTPHAAGSSTGSLSIPPQSRPPPASSPALPSASVSLPSSPAPSATASHSSHSTPKTTTEAAFNRPSPYDGAYTFSDNEIVNLVSSDEDTTPTAVKPRPKPSTKRKAGRFKGNKWSQKGNKLSRREARLSKNSKRLAESAHCSTAPTSTPVPATKSPHATKAVRHRTTQSTIGDHYHSAKSSSTTTSTLPMPPSPLRPACHSQSTTNRVKHSRLLMLPSTTLRTTPSCPGNSYLLLALTRTVVVPLSPPLELSGPPTHGPRDSTPPFTTLMSSTYLFAASPPSPTLVSPFHLPSRVTLAPQQQYLPS